MYAVVTNSYDFRETLSEHDGQMEVLKDGHD